jgi:tetratricopeptide (TPR) repeat protein
VSQRPLSAQSQAELWGAEAKRLADSGHDLAALDLYRKAADLVPGAPWLQQRTAELAKKLKRPDLAVAYFKRSAAGFAKAGFEKRCVVPLRQAWSVAREQLPRSQEEFCDIARELTQTLKRLNLAADAETLVDQTNDALRRSGIRVTLDLSGVASLSTSPDRTSWRPTLTPRSAKSA